MVLVSSLIWADAISVLSERPLVRHTRAGLVMRRILHISDALLQSTVLTIQQKAAIELYIMNESNPNAYSCAILGWLYGGNASIATLAYNALGDADTWLQQCDITRKEVVNYKSSGRLMNLFALSLDAVIRQIPFTIPDRLLPQKHIIDPEW